MLIILIVILIIINIFQTHIRFYQRSILHNQWNSIPKRPLHVLHVQQSNQIPRVLDGVTLNEMFTEPLKETPQEYEQRRDQWTPNKPDRYTWETQEDYEQRVGPEVGEIIMKPSKDHVDQGITTPRRRHDKTSLHRP